VVCESNTSIHYIDVNNEAAIMIKLIL